MPTEKSERTIEDIVETVFRAKEGGRSCALLLGAGCSASAGIPLASEFVDAVKRDFPSAYARASEKTYPACMAELAPAQRRSLIARYIDKAKLNWAHIGAAQLLAHGFVDRVLTVNFDPLLVRACSLVGVYPATYDFAASHAFNPAEVPSPSIFYLHGQRSGFALMNTETECRRQAKILKPVFEDAGRGRVWIVVGYSGENDPVFTHLSQVPRFDHNLYWIGYQKADPPIHVTEKLLSDERYAFNVSGYNADGFFITLAQRLGCFPPQIVSDPFTHLDSLLQGVCDFPVSEQKDRLDPVISTRSLLRAARQVFKTDPGARRFDELKRPYVQGKYDQVIKLARKHSDLTAREKHLFISSLLMKATLSSHVVLKRRLRTTRGRLHSIEKLIREALRMSQSGETLGSVGRTLLATSYGYPENEALRIVRRALTLLTKASKITPHGNLYNLACAQSRLGDAKKAKMLLEEALAKDEDMPGSTHVQRDPDFASMRSAAWFQKFLGKLAVRKKGIRQRELPRKIRRR